MSSKSAVLSKNSEAVIRLHEKFESGELSGDETPKQVWLSDTAFQRHKLDNFRTCYNNMKFKFQNIGDNSKFQLKLILICKFVISVQFLINFIFPQVT